ncbi:MAG: hypothetical protein GWN81_07005, partial [Phycisphaerae bacterium]|nr:hypothetical protein [Phycisphaerae bacterium]NIU08594.1 hypothetical protein [Phycisphaerae bacterium]NIX27751.1 hypothetical protein [Phycisphaerae bacterium]
MAHKGFVLTALALCVLIVYLFVDAPPPLPEESDESARVPIEQVFEIVEAENDIVRALW